MFPFYQVHKDVNKVFLHTATLNDLNFVSHLHNEYELVYILDGSIETTINNNTYTMKRGELCLINQNCIHSYKTLGYSRCFLIILESSWVKSFKSKLKNCKIVNPIIKLTKDASIEIEGCYDNIVKNIDKNYLLVKGYIYILFGYIYESIELIESNNRRPSYIEEILKFVTENFDKNISQEMVAKKVGISKYHMSRIINDYLAMNFNAYLNTLRVNYAQNLLVESDLTITDIAYQSGFQCLRSFNRAFKNITGVTPTSIREQDKQILV